MIAQRRLEGIWVSSAKNVLPNLKSMVERIAHRHVEAHVLAEEYPIVRECLLQAIKDVLGEVATAEVIAAWTEAYQVLSEAFINRENYIYEIQKLAA